VIPPDGYGDWLTGPVARAAGLENDARVGDAAYCSFGFAPVTRTSSDALARLEVRLHEVIQSLELLEKAGTWMLSTPAGSSNASEATVALEMPRGEASIHVVLDQREVSAVHVSVPSSMHVDMLPVVAEGVELADSLVATASLDISPWELDR
jgi:Ni,Fe-hydrogenase III large subunit